MSAFTSTLRILAISFGVWFSFALYQTGRVANVLTLALALALPLPLLLPPPLPPPLLDDEPPFSIYGRSKQSYQAQN